MKKQFEPKRTDLSHLFYPVSNKPYDRYAVIVKMANIDAEIDGWLKENVELTDNNK